MKKKLILTIMLFCISNQAWARIYIPINQASDKKFPIAITEFAGKGKTKTKLRNILINDLKLSGYFRILPEAIFKQHAKHEGQSIDSIRFSYWTTLETQALIKGEVSKEKDLYIINLKMFDPYIPQMLVGKEYRVGKAQLRDAVHQFANEIMKALTGRYGVFNTQIAYTGIMKRNRKNIFVMDMDGARKKQITRYKNSSFSPSWSPNGKKIVFTSYLHGQPDIYTIGKNGKGLRRLTNGVGAKITPTWSPSGKNIAFSSTVNGEAEIFIMSAEGKRHRRITDALGIDLAPEFSPDGQKIVFASEMAGDLHLFKANLNGGPLKRLTFVGYQNDMPAWSPTSNKIAFAGRDQGAFDIFIMESDGSNIQRLTIRAGDNEHPSFSPDGRFIVFSSTRTGKSEIYIMRADGSNQMKVSQGSAMLPTWGPKKYIQ